MRALALARNSGSDDDPHDVVRVHCVCGQPMHVGLHAGPTFDKHPDRRYVRRTHEGSVIRRYCRLILLPDNRSSSVVIERLGPGDSAERWLKKHRAGWLRDRER